LKRCAAESIKDVGVLPGYGDDCGRIAGVTALNERDAAGTEIGGAGFIRDIGYGLAERHGREQERKKQRDANHGHHSRGRFAAVSICNLAILYRKRKFAPEISGLIQPLEDNPRVARGLWQLALQFVGEVEENLEIAKEFRVTVETEGTQISLDVTQKSRYHKVT
jgi:hypothetical protein